MSQFARGAETFDCPHCGVPVTSGARMCRACGASADCGWTEDTDTESWSEEADDFNYDEFVAREFPDQFAASNPGMPSWARYVILAVVVSLLLTMMLS